MLELNVLIVVGSRTFRRGAYALLMGLAMAACTKDGDDRPPAKSAQRRVRDSSSGMLDMSAESYRAVPITNPGAVVGVIKLEGSQPASDDGAAMANDKSGCKIPPSKSGTKTNGLANAVVWIADVDSGKALPAEKRMDLASTGCQLEPRVQGAVVGTTLNVFNDDATLHRFVFMRSGTRDTLAVMPFYNGGELVPSERLTKKAGLVEITCPLHSWTHGYLAVFDHPYFAVTKPDGSFRIDSMPPGSYRVMVWHQGASQPVERTVSVSGGAETTVDVGIALTR